MSRNPLKTFVCILLCCFIVYFNFTFKDTEAPDSRQLIRKYQGNDPHLIINKTAQVTNQQTPSKPKSYLIFSVSGGLTNQRLSITHAIYLAKLLNIEAIALPALADTPTGLGSRPLSHIFDEEKLKGNLEGIKLVAVEHFNLPHGLNCRRVRPVPPDLYFRRFKPEEFTQSLVTQASLLNGTSEFPIIWEIGRSFASVTWDDNKLNPDHNDQNFRSFWTEMWSINYMLEYNQEIKSWSKKIVDQLDKPFHSLHMRFESDWQSPVNWTDIPDIFTNLLNSTKYGIPQGSTIYIAGGHFKFKDRVLAKLNLFYKIKSKENLLPADELSKMPSYFQASIDHLVCLESQIFVGNRRSSLDVYIKEERLAKQMVTRFYDFEQLRSAADQVIGHDYSKSEPEKVQFTDRDTVQMFFG